MKKLVLLLLMAVATGESTWAQYINNGKVVNKDGTPISGAIVRGKGLMSSTTSNMDGSFSLETTLPIKQIEATYMGKTKIENRTDYTIIKFGKRGNTSSSHPAVGSLFSSSDHPLFVAAQGGYATETENAVVGFMLGYSKSWGGYLSAMLSGDDYKLFTAGVIKRVYKAFNVYVGGGVVQYPYDDYDYYEETGSTAVLDIGLLFKINHFTVNLGMAAEFEEVASFRLGIGYAF